ncbi:MAG: Spy/CpxP family protein refolding chaperone [Bradyrhizobium sp.]
MKFEFNSPTINPVQEHEMRKPNFSIVIVAAAAFAVTLGPAAAQAGPGHAPFERLCAERGGPTHHPELADRLAEHLDLNDAQKAAFKEFHEERRKSLEAAKATLCANKPDLSSFEARLVFGQNFLEARLNALKAENPKLIAFYNSLDARQKAKFDRFRERHGRE